MRLFDDGVETADSPLVGVAEGGESGLEAASAAAKDRSVQPQVDGAAPETEADGVCRVLGVDDGPCAVGGDHESKRDGDDGGAE